MGIKTHFRLGLLASGAALVSMLQGCGSLSGLDSEGKFACKAPDGVTCMSVSGIYANSKVNNLPGMRKREVVGAQPGAQAGAAVEGASQAKGGRKSEYDYNAPDNNLAMAAGTPASPKTMLAPHSGAPMRTPERVLRVWMAPYMDAEGDLNDQKYFYVTIQGGQWLIEANRANIRKEFQQITPLQRTVSKQKDAAPSPEQQAQQMMAPPPASQDLPVSPVDANPGAGTLRDGQ